MLILTRRVGERLMVGDDIVVKVIRIDGNQVRIGIDAPRDVRIVREEIMDQPVPEQRRVVRDDEHLVIGQCSTCYAINRHEPNCAKVLNYAKEPA